MTIIIALQDSQHFGDNDNALGVANALQRRNHNAPVVPCLEHEVAEALAFAKANPTLDFIVTAAGEQSLDDLTAFADLPQVTTVWSGHKSSQPLIDKAASIDFVHVPQQQLSHALQVRCKNAPITTDTSVPHSKTVESFHQAYAESPFAAITRNHPDSLVIGVMLAGDTKDAQGQEYHYSAEEAYMLGKYAGTYAHAANGLVLATNGNTTGGFEQTSRLDNVSAAFMQGLQDSGLPLSQWLFEDFKRSDGISHYDAIVGAVQHTDNSVLFIPGNSVSMLSQVTHTTEPQKVVAYDNHAMQPLHHQEVSALFNKGLCKQLNFDNSRLTEPREYATSPAVNPADIIADRVANRELTKAHALARAC